MKPFNIKEFLKKRPLSWSAISSFEYDPEQWYKRYVLNEKQPDSKEMIFGKELALSIENNTCVVPNLLKVLQKKKEHPFKVVFNGIPMVGYADAFCDKSFKYIDEVKTGKKVWTQKRADEHGQITMYVLMNYITNKVLPEEVSCALHWIPTEENGNYSIDFVRPVTFHTFYTKRSMKDMLLFGARINKTVKEMEQYVLRHI